LKDKHLHIPEDSLLLKEIYRRVDRELAINREAFRRLLLTKLVFYVALMSVSYYGLFVIENPWLFMACFIGYGFSALLFAFNFSHDCSHNTVFKSRKWNNFAFTAIYTMVGAHAEAWKERHVHSHHYAPNVEDYDSDLKISNIIRVIPNSDHRWFHRLQHWYAPLAYMSYSLFWVFIKDFVILFSKDEYTTAKGFSYHLSFWLQKSCYFAYLLVLPLLFSGQSWIWIVVSFLAMHLTQSLFLLFTFFMTHHVELTAYPTTNAEGCINTSWLMNQIRSSNDMHPFSKTANFLLGGFNNHIAHHLFPHIHHIHYPELNGILYEMLGEKGIIPNQTSYLGGIRSHLRLLKKMSKKEEMVTEPFDFQTDPAYQNNLIFNTKDTRHTR
jgi:linoleoyl-CoA desaturase